MCLNPYLNGRWFESHYHGDRLAGFGYVLILIWLEDGLEVRQSHITPQRKGLNPYLNGRWFESEPVAITAGKFAEQVLILI